ncbi:Glycine cleavage system transcriptional activator GcvA [Klebsiella pneumoniae ISC21]|nr:Glycine cleavage system transcriptional activator GcvA [Klebsiella pneumoniae ISC21]
MSKRLPPLNALRVFDAAARHLSFTRAADELFVTQAAVSHQIKSLEDFLGLKLFRRRNRSLLLTEEGQSYFQDIKEIFSQLTEATRKLQARSAKGALTVSLLPSFAIQWLVPRLTSFNSAYPGIDVRIQAVDRQEDKLADDVDVAIFYGRGNWPGLRVEKIVRRVSAAGLFPALAHRRQSIENACRSGATYPASRCVPPRLANLYPSAWSKPY